MRGSPEKTDGRRLHLVDSRDAVQETLYVRMLGGFTVSAGARDIEHHEWGLKKAANVVKLLALEPRHRLHRERVMDLLWSGLNPKKAANNLYRTLHVARKTLNLPAGSHRCLQLRDGQLVLSPTGELWVDVSAFEAAATTARNLREPAAYRRALELYGGELLPEDVYEEWSQEPRNRLVNLHLDLCVELAALYAEHEEYGRAVETLERALAEDPTSEEAHAGLMRIYALTGRQSKAIKQYERLKDAFWREFEVEPGKEVVSLYAEIAAGEYPAASEGVDRVPERKSSRRQGNLPDPVTSFIGREREISEVKRILDTTRLLTLTGVGGAGKTRLALEVAREAEEDFPDGVWWAELASVTDPDFVTQALAKALGVREHTDQLLVEVILNSLRETKALLILDNCEHLVEAVAGLVEELLEGCPYIQVLATSREVIGARGEASWQVPALSVSDPDSQTTVQELNRYEGARLFLDRARQRVPNFSPTEQNASAIARICTKLDGIPLPIELAAARVGTLSVDQISERLDDSLRLLSAGPRAAESRQRTLRGALDWSHELLDDVEQKLFRRLAVFTGGFTLKATEAVTSLEKTSKDNTLDLLSNLIDKSLVAVSPGTERRYRLLEPVRQYALEKLRESDEYADVRCRHFRWCLGFAELAKPKLTGRDQIRWQARLEAEHDNIRAALSWGFETGETEAGLQLAAALWLFWYTQGHLTEGRAWLRRGLSSDAEQPQTRAGALMGAGWLALFQREYETAEELLKESLALYRELDNKDGVASCLTKLGYGAVLGGRNLASIPAYLGEALQLLPELQDGRVKANVLILAGMAAISRRDVENAVASFHKALEIAHNKGDAQNASISLFNLGFITLGDEDLDRATSLFRESLQLSRESGDRLVFMYTGYGLAGIAATRGNPLRAARLWGAVEAVCEATGLGLDAMTTSRHEHRLDRARSELGREAFDAEREKGRAMTREEAVVYALSEEPVALTPREREVAGLAARGLGNRRISEELVISQRTVETHLKNVFKKLGVGSRKDLSGRLEDQA